MIADTTIMMVTYNRLDLTKETIERALKQTGRKYNLVVIDNNSTDGTREYLKELSTLGEWCQEFRYKLLSKNYGIGIGRSMCLKMMLEHFPESRYLVTLDNDVAIPNTSWLQDCVDVLNFAPNAGVCAINYENKVFPKTKIHVGGREIPIQIILNTPGTATVVFSRKVFDKIGYFVDYGIYGHDDANYFVRVRLASLQTKHLYYLDQPGIHLGDGPRDQGEYREMKTKLFNENKPKFFSDLRAYQTGQKSLYVDFQGVNE